MIELREVSKAYGDTLAIDGLSLAIGRGELVVLIGASGSGKSTLLKMTNRLVEHDRGMVLFQGEQVRSFRPEDLRRRMGYAIQSIGLFPHWSVARNIATVPALLGWPAARIAARVDELLALLGLDPALYRERYPQQLSGGQQQRVGVARALAADPEVLLMDEPFGALDPVNRLALQQELARIHRASGKTIVLVTHDIDEALRLATRVVLLDRGRIVQEGTPAQLLAEPANAGVSDFIGRSDLGLRLLGLQTVAERLRAGEPADGEAIAATLSLRDALSLFVTRRTERLPVVDAAGRPLGAIHFADLLRPAG
jgi:osmoprotectant transport system ATP-binding protein